MLTMSGLGEYAIHSIMCTITLFTETPGSLLTFLTQIPKADNHLLSQLGHTTNIIINLTIAAGKFCC